MDYRDLLPLIRTNDEKIVLLILGGIGGIQSGPNMLTELQQAHRPHLNALARKSQCGLIHPIAPGITPAPHVALKRLLGWQGQLPPDWHDQLGLKSCAFSAHPDYLSLFDQAGIKTIPCSESPADLLEQGCAALSDKNFVILHFASPEKEALQGGYYEKIKTIEELDVYLGRLRELAPDVLSVCGEHSCPSALAEITWHPVPVLIQAKRARYDMVQSFDEIACASGSLGTLNATDLLPLLLAHAGKLTSAYP